MLADQAPQDALDARHDGVEIEHLEGQDLFSAESQELAREHGRPLRGLLDQLDVGPPGVLLGQGGEKQVGASADHRQEVVEVVGDAARELAHRLHLLRLPELLLELFLLREIDEDPHRACHPSPRVDEGSGGGDDVDEGAIPSPPLRLVERGDAPAVLGDRGVELGALVIGNGGHRLPEHLVLVPAKHARGALVPQHDAPGLVHGDDGHGRGVDEGLEPLARVAKGGLGPPMSRTTASRPTSWPSLKTLVTLDSTETLTPSGRTTSVSKDGSTS